MNHKIYCVFALVFILASSQVSNAQKIKNVKDYFTGNSKVGLIVVSEIGYYGRNGASGFGLVGAAIASSTSPKGSKYEKALTTLEPTLKPDQKVNEFYHKLFTELGKTVTDINEDFNKNALADFQAPKVKGKKYYEKDLQFLKNKYQVDEVLIIYVKYGVRSIFSYGVIEQNRRGVAKIESTIVSLTDNSYTLHDFSETWNKIDGAWDTPPTYENLSKSISDAIDKALAKERERYFKKD